MTDPSPRSREAPADRLAPRAAVFDLHQAAQELRAEPGTLGHGHRQMVLARHGGATVALFSFEAGAGLDPHQVKGTVTIQCVEGDLSITAQGAEHRLAAGGLSVMAPGVRHSVRGVQRSLMLLTVALQSDREGP